MSGAGGAGCWADAAAAHCLKDQGPADASVPGTVLFCALGALAGDVARFGEVLSGQADGLTWALRIVGVLATFAVVWLVGRAAQRALQSESPESDR